MLYFGIFTKAGDFSHRAINQIKRLDINVLRADLHM